MLLKSLIYNVDPSYKIDSEVEKEFLNSPNSEYEEKTEYPKLPPDFLASMCEVEDRKPTQSRLSEKSEYLHVSSLLDLCPRQYALTRYYQLEVTEKVNSGQRIIWNIGKSLEKHAIDNIAKYHGKNLVLSDLEILNEEYMIQGAPDVLVQIDENLYLVVEIKTMNARDFKQLEAPRGDHVLQAAMYQWLVEQEDYDVHDHVIVLYIAKDALRGMSPYKEYQIDTKELHIQKGVNIALDLAAEYKNCREKGLIPKRSVCSRRDCSRANQCRVSDICFGSPEEEYNPDEIRN